MKKIIFILLTSIIFLTLAVSRDTQERTVKNMNSWHEVFDINKKKTGKYNILITVNDIGGNQTLAGPYNIFIDPDSDLPVAGITNPLNDMRVPGNLNIVGTCVDDDGVDHVDIVLDGDTKHVQKAEGKEFWSYFLDTTKLKEGVHSIQVVGTDINGLKGKPVSVIWNLDRKVPVSSVSNFGMGQLVHGKIDLKGTITDGNGIKKLYCSTDGGKKFQEIKIKENKKKACWTFKKSLDTKKFKDGPTVIWFRAQDKQGSIGIYSYLCFIDNTCPDAKIVYPKKTDVVNGKFTVAGYAKDVVELKSLSWTFGKESGSFKLIPGNPYWSKDFDTTGVKGDKEDFSITATDTAGNVTVKKLKILLNQQNDKPVVKVSWPKQNAVLDEKGLYIRGIASDDDKVASVTYSVDGGNTATQKTCGVFYAKIEHKGIYKAGEHQVTVFATDINGVKGDPVIITWKSKGTVPVFSRPEIQSGKNSVPVTYGIKVSPESSSVYTTTVSSNSGIKRVKAVVSWGNGQKKEIAINPEKVKNEIPVSIPVTEDSPWGIIKITVSATDIYNRISQERSLIHVENLTKVETESPSVIFDDSTVNKKGEVTVKQGAEVSGYFIGGTASKVTLDPETDSVKATLKDNTIILKQSASSGKDETVTVGITTDQGITFESKPLVFKASKTKKAVTAVIKSVGKDSYRSGMPVELPVSVDKENQKSITIAIDSAESVSHVSYTITGKNNKEGSALQSGNAALSKIVKDSPKRTATIALSALPAGIVKLSCKIFTGKTTITELDGTLIIVRKKAAGQIDDERKIYWFTDSSVTYDSKTDKYHLKAGQSITGYANVNNPAKAILKEEKKGLSVSLENHKILLTASEDGSFDNIVAEITDSNGITYESSAVSMIVDSETPDTVIAEPSLFEWVKKSLVLQGTATDKNGVAKVEYSLNDGKTWSDCTVERGENTKKNLGVTWKSDIDCSSLAEGLISIDVRATDEDGQQSVVRTAVQKDTIAPSAKIIVPETGDVINGETQIVLQIKDAGSLEKAVYIKPSEKESVPLKVSNSIVTMVGTKNQPLKDAMSFEFSDAAGNTTKTQKWPFTIDEESDLPRVEIHMPTENEIITRDFTVTGVVYDDDGDSKVWYKIDDNEYQALPKYSSSFNIKIPLSSMTDNEHVVTLYAEDIHGIKGKESSCPFRISLEEPKGSVLKPEISKTVKNMVTISGVASDKNKIAKVQVSVDNGNSYNDATGTENWSYSFDTKAIPDGTHVVFIKVFDGYGIQALYSSLINIDNTKPDLNLDLPLDDSKTTGPVFFSGYSTDNIGVTDMSLVVHSLDGNKVTKELQSTEVPVEKIVTKNIDLSSLDNGFYNVEIVAKDAAGNITRVSRNIQLDKTVAAAKVSLLYPLNSEHKQGEFNIYGQTVSEKPVTELILFIDGSEAGTTKLSSAGYFKFNIKAGTLSKGTHTYKVRARLKDGETVESEEQSVIYNPYGPWVSIDNFTYGSFAIDRPFLRGKAGYVLTKKDLAAAKAKTTDKEEKEKIADKTVQKVEISFDNGKNFIQVSKKNNWAYRIENDDIKEGYHFLLVRATMKNGETAITRTIVQIDKTNPEVRLISPGEGGRYNQKLDFSGLSSDNVGLKNVTLALRKGDKASYEVPEFIQGLYLDFQFWGATLYNVGMGLTFFDNNVKLQAQWGQFTQAQRNLFTLTNLRYGGDSIFGIKILANVGSIPFRYFFGPDWDWLSAAVTVGADFSRFNESSSGKAQVLSALLGQIEIPRVSLKTLAPNMKFFSSVSLYTEFQLWFIPTDVTSTVDIKNIVPQFSEGLRLNVF